MNPDRLDTQLKPVLDTDPEGRLAIIPLKSTLEISRKINDYLVEWRKARSESGTSSASLIRRIKAPFFSVGICPRTSILK